MQQPDIADRGPCLRPEQPGPIAPFFQVRGAKICAYETLFDATELRKLGGK